MSAPGRTGTCTARPAASDADSSGRDRWRRVRRARVAHFRRCVEGRRRTHDDADRGSDPRTRVGHHSRSLAAKPGRLPPCTCRPRVSEQRRHVQPRPVARRGSFWNSHARHAPELEASLGARTWPFASPTAAAARSRYLRDAEARAGNGKTQVKLHASSRRARRSGRTTSISVRGLQGPSAATHGFRMARALVGLPQQRRLRLGPNRVPVPDRSPTPDRIRASGPRFPPAAHRKEVTWSNGARGSKLDRGTATEPLTDAAGRLPGPRNSSCAHSPQHATARSAHRFRSTSSAPAPCYIASSHQFMFRRRPLRQLGPTSARLVGAQTELSEEVPEHVRGSSRPRSSRFERLICLARSLFAATPARTLRGALGRLALRISRRTVEHHLAISAVAGS